MIKKKKNILAQSGVIPFTFKNKNLRILLITNSRKNKWLFPKGLVEKNMSKEESAALEAYEEAGVLGEVLNNRIGSYKINKYNSICKIDMYPLFVEKTLKSWPEMEMRKRKWINPDDIEKYIKDKKLLRIFKNFAGMKYYKRIY